MDSIRFYEFVIICGIGVDRIRQCMHDADVLRDSSQLFRSSDLRLLLVPLLHSAMFILLPKHNNSRSSSSNNNKMKYEATNSYL